MVYTMWIGDAVFNKGRCMAKTIDQSVGERIRFYRIAAGMKQKELAAKLSLSYQQVQKYETGKDKVSIGRLFEIAKVLFVSPIAFLEGLKGIDVTYNRQTLNLMKYFSDVSNPKDRQIIVDIVKIFSEK